MEGRWTIYVDREGDVIHNDDESTHGLGVREVYVVPCDDAAIERGVTVMLANGGVDTTSEPLGEAREDYARGVVEAVLRAAGETP